MERQIVLASSCIERVDIASVDGVCAVVVVVVVGCGGVGTVDALNIGSMQWIVRGSTLNPNLEIRGIDET